MMFVYFLVAILISSLKYLLAKITCLPFPDPKLCVYIINSSHYFDAVQRCEETMDGTLAYGEVAKVFINSTYSDDTMLWIGLRFDEKLSQWRWIDNSVEDIDKSSSLWATDNLEQSNSSEPCVFIYQKKLFKIDCLTQLTRGLCQRPKRETCHRWNVTYPCVWIDDECVQETFHYYHESDVVGSQLCEKFITTTSKHLCNNLSMCTGCKLSDWAPWSTCHPWCSNNSESTRYRYIINSDEKFCNQSYFKLYESISCNSTCEDGKATEGPKVIPDTITEEEYDYYSEEPEPPTYADVVINWFIIVLIVVLCGAGVIVGLVIYQKLQRKYKFHQKIFTPSTPETSGPVSAEGQCGHKADQICHCKSVSVTVTRSLDKLGFWCH